MTEFVRRTLERRLSAALGLPVRIDGLTLSLVGGTLDVRGLTVGDGPRPLLTVRRVRASVAVGRALKGEIVVSSVAIEAPVLSLTRSAEGGWGLPPPRPADVADEAPAIPPPDAAEAPAVGRWSFDCRTALIVDGRVAVHVERGRGAPPLEIVTDRILAKLGRADGSGMDGTLIAESVTIAGAELGELRGRAAFEGAANVGDLPTAAITGEASQDLGLRLQFESPGAATGAASGTFGGAVDVARIRALMPLLPARAAAILAMTADAGGRVEFSVRADRRDGRTRVAEIVVRGVNWEG
jgi:uncharacterized protein involved in outer membrane biogenesis